MRTITGRTVLALFLAFGTPAFPQTSPQPTRLIETKIHQLNSEEVAAFLRKDPEVLARLWSDDFVVTNPLNKFVNKQQVLGMVKKGVLAFGSYDRQIEYLHVYGDTTVVAGSETVLWAGGMPKAGQTEHLRFTAVWIKEGEQWREVARHANVVP